MSSEILKKNFQTRLSNFIKKNKKYFVYTSIIIFFFILAFLFIQNLKKKNEIKISEEYTQATILIKQKKLQESKLILESIINKEWNHLKNKREGVNAEISRHIMLGLIPLGIWFAWWTALGQTDGMMHPRDIDPGNLFLKGGYIGDRLSPSNTWVGFMGAGPIILIGVLWWNLFRSNGWPLQMAFVILAVRISALALQLSISPNMPRLVFKIGWDIVFCLMIIFVVAAYMLYEKWLDRDSEAIAQ